MLDGELEVEAAIELDAQRNAQFARRQRTWFRREPSLEVIDAAVDPTPTAVDRLDRFVERLARTPPAGILTTP